LLHVARLRNPKGNNDWERGMQRGYERALDDVADCIQKNGVDRVLGDCLALRTILLAGEISDGYMEGTRRAGAHIENLIVLEILRG
jgi:hypothetical protein